MKDESELRSHQIKACNVKISHLSKEIETLLNSLQEKEDTAAQLQTYQQPAISPEQFLELTAEVVYLKNELQEAEYLKQQTKLEMRNLVHEMKARKRFKKQLLERVGKWK